MAEYYACASAHKVAEIMPFCGSWEVTIWDVAPRPFHYGTFKLSKIATHMFEMDGKTPDSESRERALNSLSWHGVVWFRVEDCDDVVDAAARLFCAEVV